jgi:hypothetical protein
MNNETIARHRLAQHQLVAPRFTEPHEVAGWMGAMQAQDYLGSLWALGVRVPGATERAIEAAIARRTIVRSWPMRGTIHWMAAQDVRWMLTLLTPRIVQNFQGRLRELGIDAPTLAASADAVGRALEGGVQLPRPALYDVLQRAGIATDGQRGVHILGQLAHAQVICFGSRAGKQPTFALLDEWIAPTPPLPREEALAMLATRYFTSHGPATRQDFAFWAGLTVADAKTAIAGAGTALRHHVVDGVERWSSPDIPAAPLRSPTAWLLPPFDEWLVAYRDRSAVIDAGEMNKVVPGGNGIFFPIVVLDGRVVGTWKRTLRAKEVVLQFSPFRVWSDDEHEAVLRAAENYAAFLELSLRIEERGVAAAAGG